MTGGNVSTAILGVGAMGMLIAGYLSRVTNVTALGTWPAQIETVTRDGLWITDPDGRRHHCRPHIAYRTQRHQPFAVIFVLVKSYQMEAVCQDLPSLLQPDGLVITLQNGLGNLDLLAGSVGADRVTQGVTAHGATVTAPGRLHHAGRGATSLAAQPARAARLAATVSTLARAGLNVDIVDDVDGLIWGKLAVNAAINPLTALLEVPNGALVTDAGLRSAMLAAALEVEAVATALGLQLPYKNVEDQVIRVATTTAQNRSSMLQDIDRGGRTEIDAINGAIISTARSVAVPVPMNELLYRLMTEKQAAAIQSTTRIRAQLRSIHHATE